MVQDACVLVPLKKINSPSPTRCSETFRQQPKTSENKYGAVFSRLLRRDYSHATTGVALQRPIVSQLPYVRCDIIVSSVL